MSFSDKGTMPEFVASLRAVQGSVSAWETKALFLARLLRDLGGGKVPFTPEAVSAAEMALESVKLPTNGGETGALMRWAKARRGGSGTSGPPVYRVEAAQKMKGASAKELLAEILEASKLLSGLWSYVDEVGESVALMIAKPSPDEALVAREAYAYLDGLLGYYTTLRAVYVLVRALASGKSPAKGVVVREHSQALTSLASAVGIHLHD